MNINPFKRLSRLEAALAELREDNRALRKELAEYWNLMAKLPSIAVIEDALAVAKKSNSRLDQIRDRFGEDQINLNTRVNYLESENEARKVGAGYLDKRLVMLAEDLIMLKASRNMMTPEEVSRQSIAVQRERDRAKQRGYNVAYRERQKAKAEADRRKAKRLEYQRAYRARKQAEKAAQEASK